jgi:hypothetical protein
LSGWTGQFTDRGQQLPGILDQPDQLDVRYLGQQRRRALPHQEVVLREHHPQRRPVGGHAVPSIGGTLAT